jgi:hypothetical protein
MVGEMDGSEALDRGKTGEMGGSEPLGRGKTGVMDGSDTSPSEIWIIRWFPAQKDSHRAQHFITIYTQEQGNWIA